jgi:hypothetical protein
MSGRLRSVRKTGGQKLGPVHQSVFIGLVRPLAGRQVGEGLDAPDPDDGQDALLNETQRLHDLGDALAGDVLERAGLENVDDLVGHLVRQRDDFLVVVVDVRQVAHMEFQALAGGQDALGRGLGGRDDGVELV